MSLSIPERPERLVTLERYVESESLQGIELALRRDHVVLVKNVQPEDADAIVVGVANKFDLREKLELHSEFGSAYGHRERVGRYFMTVDKRRDYQFILPHSEGNRQTSIHLAAFYSFENTTDGGYTVLLNTVSESPMWDLLRERTTKVDLCGMSLSHSDILKIRMMHKVHLPEDLLLPTDQVQSEIEPSPIPRARSFLVLAIPRKSHSQILNRDLHVFWDNISSTDRSSAMEYERLLRDADLLREPPGGLDLSVLDDTFARKSFRSGVQYASLFSGSIVRKLLRGEMVIFNNFSWTHSCTNWTPTRDRRNVAAAFA